MSIVIKQVPALTKGMYQTLDKKSCRFIASPLSDEATGFLILSWKQKSFEGWEPVPGFRTGCTDCYLVKLTKKEILEQMRNFYGKNVEIVWKD